MNAHRALLLALALAASAGAAAQPALNVGLSGGYAVGKGPGGPALDGSIGLRWGRLLVNAHVAELTYQEAFVSPYGTRSSRVDYRAGFDLGYALPVGRSFALTAGAGTRVTRSDYSGQWGYSGPLFLYSGIIWEGPAAFDVFARAEVYGNLAFQDLSQLQVGVTVPLTGPR